MNRSIGRCGKFFVVRHNNKCLAQLVAQVKKEFVQLSLVPAIQTSGRLVG